MKALPFEIPKASDTSLILQIDEGPGFYPHFHSHKETQITLVEKGHGNAFIGDWSGPFTEGDIFILGSYVPHVFKSEQQGIRALTIFIHEDSLGSGFFDLPETRGFIRFLRLRRAWKVVASKREIISQRILDVHQKQRLHSLASAMFLFDELSDTQSVEMLTSGTGSWARSTNQSQRLGKVLDYLAENYLKAISLAEISAIANLSPSAFSRFFSLCTGRTFTAYLNDLRIGHACQKLIHTDLDILSISQLASFNNVSNFNRQFRKFKGMTPREYRKRYRGLG